MFEVAEETWSWCHTVNCRGVEGFASVSIVMRKSSKANWLRWHRVCWCSSRSPRGRDFWNKGWFRSGVLTRAFMCLPPVCDLTFLWAISSRVASTTLHGSIICASVEIALLFVACEGRNIGTRYKWGDDEFGIGIHVKQFLTWVCPPPFAGMHIYLLIPGFIPQF